MYKAAVEDWVEYDDPLPDTNQNKISKGMRGLPRKSQLFRQAGDLCSVLS